MRFTKLFVLVLIASKVLIADPMGNYTKDCEIIPENCKQIEDLKVLIAHQNEQLRLQAASLSNKFSCPAPAFNWGDFTVGIVWTTAVVGVVGLATGKIK